ncbi:MAG TPA: sigma-70 family RNA polymerase sigma factor [Bryobacteraceae bacterium]|nr:sigma-70 family RNA polymerase sigma factor [Bryobacteraceae bacterium]
MTLPGLLLALELSGENDEDLAHRLSGREPRAMAEIYDRFGKLVYSVTLNIVREAAVAEDLVQETFLRVWTRIRAFDPARGALGPWLLAIARNHAIDYVRSARSRVGRTSIEFDAADHPQLFNDMERDLLNSQHAKLLKKAMSELSENQRKVIELAYYEGLSQTEMAEKVSEPLGTVETWTRTALRQLRARITAGVSV